MSLLRKAKTKRVLCTHCGKPNEVGGNAMSVFCNHCRKRLILEDYTIKSYQGVKGYATCGDVVVEKSGRVNAGIQAGNLTIKGHVNGQVLARGTVHVAKTGVLIGSVEAHALDILPGAAINAVCRIGPPKHSIDEPAPQAATAPPPPAESSPATDEAPATRPRRERIPDEPVIEGAAFAPSVIRPREVAARQRAASEAAAVARANAKKAVQPATDPVAEKATTKRKKVSTKTAAKKPTVKKAKTKTTAAKKTKDTSVKSASGTTVKKSDDKKPATKKKIKKITTRRTKKSE